MLDPVDRSPPAPTPRAVIARAVPPRAVPPRVAPPRAATPQAGTLRAAPARTAGLRVDPARPRPARPGAAPPHAPPLAPCPSGAGAGGGAPAPTDPALPAALAAFRAAARAALLGWAWARSRGPARPTTPFAAAPSWEALFEILVHGPAARALRRLGVDAGVQALVEVDVLGRHRAGPQRGVLRARADGRSEAFERLAAWLSARDAAWARRFPAALGALPPGDDPALALWREQLWRTWRAVRSTG